MRLESGHEKAIIQEVLPRATEIARIKRVGREKQVRRQVLAANVDVVFICQSLTGSGLDERLLMRQMVAVCGCKATPVFVLTKCDDVEQTVVNDARERCAELAPNIALVCLAQVPADACPEGVQTPKALRQFLPAGSTALLLGESGVGKSTLTNALVGEEVFATGSVRERDDKGRHTTVARRMVQVPGAGLLIDAPGLRTMQILDLETGLSRAFPEIGEYAQQCRFANCSHTSEPGCEVREHVLPDRLNVYLHLSENRL